MTTDTPSLETLTYAVANGVATITFNRPDKRNAINQQMQRDLQTVLKTIQRDRSVRAVLLTGTGAAFSAGQDLTEFVAAHADESFRVDEHVRSTFNRVVLTLRGLELPVIAAINGMVAGAGWSIALAADIRFASADARFTQGFSKIGLVPDTGATWFLPELIGTARALELAFASDVIDVATAHAWGLVNFVVPAAELVAAATSYAERLAAMPTRALGLTKRAIYRATTSSLEDQLEYEAQLQQSAAAGADHMEGVMAFLEKRAPVFTGR